MAFGLQACALEWSLSTAEPGGGGSTTNSADADGAAPSRPLDAGEAGDAGEDASIPIVDAGIPDVTVVGDDAGERVDASACDDMVCDCDGDGFNDLSREGCATAAGPNDCDDSDTRTHPNQTFVELPAESPRNGDWNCRDGVEKLYPSKVSCGLLALGACAGIQGFQGEPACGEEGTYVFCAPVLGLLCGVGTTSTRRQACR